MLKNNLKRWLCSSEYSVSGWIRLTECLRRCLVDSPFCYINLRLTCWSYQARWRSLLKVLCWLLQAVKKYLMLTFSIYKFTRIFTNPLYLYLLLIFPQFSRVLLCSAKYTAESLQILLLSFIHWHQIGNKFQVYVKFVELQKTHFCFLSLWLVQNCWRTSAWFKYLEAKGVKYLQFANTTTQ